MRHTSKTTRYFNQILTKLGIDSAYGISYTAGKSNETHTQERQTNMARTPKQYTFTALTVESAKTLKSGAKLYNVKYRNADGSPMRIRVNGAVKIWKTRPNDFRIPFKYGMYDYGYVTPENMASWATEYKEI